MTPSTLFTIVFVAIVLAFYAGQRKAISIKAHQGKLHSLPFYHGAYIASWTIIPALAFFSLWSAIDAAIIKSMVTSTFPESYLAQDEAQRQLTFSAVRRASSFGNISQLAAELQPSAQKLAQLSHSSGQLGKFLSLMIAIIGFALTWFQSNSEFNARSRFESVAKYLLLAAASLAVFTTAGIVFSVLFESIRFFDSVSIVEFVFGTHWSPQISIREGQAGSSGSFGAVPLFVGTMLISAIALLVAVPIGLMSAIYLAEYASPRVRSYVKPLLEILAGIPTVVYGFFAAITVAPLIRNFGESLGLSVASESALAAGLVMGVMIIPFVSSLSDDVISAVPQALRDGSLGLGATKSETIRQVVIPAALPGIVGGVLLAASRAIGETMIVVMAAGLSAKLTANPLDAVTTVTVQIVTLLVGDQEFDSPKTLAAFSLGLMLFITTLLINVFALQIVKRYREQYE